MTGKIECKTKQLKIKKIEAFTNFTIFKYDVKPLKIRIFNLELLEK